jgi:hypothetical protein
MKGGPAGKADWEGTQMELLAERFAVFGITFQLWMPIIVGAMALIYFCIYGSVIFWLGRFPSTQAHCLTLPGAAMPSCAAL